ncbi:putative laccase 6 precursor [Suillus lakei]|nr:putative laccase 6 precursor [Suillus lakei]
MSNRATLVNGIFPGPLVAAQKGDDFAIEVVNELQDESMFMSTSVYWHGLYQDGTNYADGTGTYWYHNHYSVQYRDDLRGALIVYDPHDPLAHTYDVDDASTVITLSDWYHTVTTVLRHVIGNTASSSFINGLGRDVGGPMSDLAVIDVQQGKRYRMRLISMSCDPNFRFSIDGHNLTVIETEEELTEPRVVDQLQIFVGGRYSVVLVVDKPLQTSKTMGREECDDCRHCECHDLL